MSTTAPQPPTERTRVRRGADRGRYDRATIEAVLDEGLVAHVGFAVDGRPWVMPMAYARVDDVVYLHGAVGNHALRTIAAGAELCLTVTLLDGLVLSRSAFHHSMNYRSVLVFGHGRLVQDPAEKLAASDALVEHMVPGRAADTRTPSDAELRSTQIIALPLTEASAKVRTGGPEEDPHDIGVSHWAGHLPLGVVAGQPVQDRQAPTDAALPLPAYLIDQVRHHRPGIATEQHVRQRAVAPEHAREVQAHQQHHRGVEQHVGGGGRVPAQ